MIIKECYQIVLGDFSKGILQRKKSYRICLSGVAKINSFINFNECVD